MIPVLIHSSSFSQVLAGAGLRPHRPPGSRLPPKLALAGGHAFAETGDGPEKQVRMVSVALTIAMRSMLDPQTA